MMEMEQSNCEYPLRYPCMSELVVPTHETLITTSSSTRALSTSNVDSKADFSTCSSSAIACSEVPSAELYETHSDGKLVDCIYKAAGCTERVPQGTLAETEHHQSCQYRPMPCLMQHTCKQLVPFHNFLLHHMQHFIYPSFSSILNTSVVFQREDFDCDHRWQPRWMNCYDKHFFVMITHKIPGMWYFWVWMLGTPEEAKEHAYDIEISRRQNRKIGTFPVLSLRTSEDELEKEKQEICLSMTDYQIKRISQIRDNVVGSFEIDLVIHKLSSSSINRFWLLGKEDSNM